MMASFVVVNPAGINQENYSDLDFMVSPNPVKDKLFVSSSNPALKVYYIKIFDAAGRTIYMMPMPKLNEGIDMRNFKPGTYTIQVTDEKFKQTITKKFIVE